MNKKIIERLYQKLSDSFPDAKSELCYENHFELLIAVILSAQTTDKAVNKVTLPLFSKHPLPFDLVKLGESKLREKIKTIGLAPTKAKNIIKTCKILIEQYGSKVPSTYDALINLPGVGRKTANVVLNEGFGHPTIAVDTHVFRISNRTGLAPGNNVLETEKKLLDITPAKWKIQAHRYLILHGRYICKAKNFDCTNCSIISECEFEDKVIRAK